MIYREEFKDLFTVDKSYCFAHCISADFALGAGIAREFRKAGTAKELEDHYPKDFWQGRGYVLKTFSPRTTYNLVTKGKYYGKPTYDTIKEALNGLRAAMVADGQTKVAMPLIGCGLDKLEWNKVKTIIAQTFNDTDIEVLVCKLK